MRPSTQDRKRSCCRPDHTVWATGAASFDTLVCVSRLKAGLISLRQSPRQSRYENQGLRRRVNAPRTPASMWRGLVIVALCLSRLVLSADIGVIGSGFSGLAAALEAASLGHKVTVYESNSAPGGRAQVLEAEGFSFDMVPLVAPVHAPNTTLTVPCPAQGPSWYWMPEIYDKVACHAPS